ncbi:MAG TPA: GAF domain-containing protein, partial [Caulobacteraceae bacterium]|nr:GAF domain-containing protein [Caulobacteraceae bacterium]
MKSKAKRPTSPERARLRAIRAIDLDDARAAFDRIARTAQRLAKTRYAQVSIVGADQVFIVGGTGTPVRTADRKGSITAQAIEQDAVLWVADAKADPRFGGNRHMTQLDLRFYAGAPVILSNGSRIGALSILDPKPRPHDAELASALQDLAALVAHEWDR